jgi:hypothetical protein
VHGHQAPGDVDPQTLRRIAVSGFGLERDICAGLVGVEHLRVPRTDVHGDDGVNLSRHHDL